MELFASEPSIDSRELMSEPNRGCWRPSEPSRLPSPLEKPAFLLEWLLAAREPYLMTDYTAKKKHDSSLKLLSVGLLDEDTTGYNFGLPSKKQNITSI
jgi:hypothetical protein